MNDDLAGASPVDQPVGRPEPERAEDRVLLGLAGAVADCGVRWEVDYGCYSVPSAHGPRRWNPLTDDGDALRLAVKLRLNLNFEEWDGAEYACAVPHKSHQGQDEVIDDDENAAARRAIVRAAAALAGSKTPNQEITGA